MASRTEPLSGDELLTIAMNMLGEVEVFNREILGVPIPEHPEPISEGRGLFRLSHMREELDEFEATLAHTYVGSQEKVADLADAMVDLIYVAMGTLLEMGVTPGPAFAAVHDANMKKRRGEVAKRPGALGHDAIKPEGWTPPDMVEACFRVTPAVARELSPAFVTATNLRIQRGKTYNQGSVKLQDYFPLGRPSYFQMVWLKLLRARSIMEGAEGSLQDSLQDMLNYLAFWCEYEDGRTP